MPIAAAYGCQPEQVWGIWNEIRPRFYVEGNKDAETQPKKTHPPVGRLICYEGKDPETIERVLQTAASTLAESPGIPGNIFIMYDEAKSGEVIAGDGIVRKKL
jgi:hypothetical protein